MIPPIEPEGAGPPPAAESESRAIRRREVPGEGSLN